MLDRWEIYCLDKYSIYRNQYYQEVTPKVGDIVTYDHFSLWGHRGKIVEILDFPYVMVEWNSWWYKGKSKEWIRNLLRIDKK